MECWSFGVMGENLTEDYKPCFRAYRDMIIFSIHKPPASIRFEPIKHALAVTVEPFKFSSRRAGWLMN